MERNSNRSAWKLFHGSGTYSGKKFSKNNGKQLNYQEGKK